MDEIQPLKDRIAHLERQVELLMLKAGVTAPARSSGDLELEIIMRRSAITLDMTEFNNYIKATRSNVVPLKTPRRAAGRSAIRSFR